MTWEVVARKDFQDAVRSHWLWALSALFVTVLALPPALVIADVIQVGGGDGLTTDLFVFLMRDTMTLLVPIIAVVLAYASITGERDSGTLKLLLSLPHSRRDVVAGKALGRGAVIVLPVLAGFVVAAVVFLATPVSLNAGPFFAFAALSALIGIVFVAISVGVSAGSGSSRASMIGAVGVYVVFTLFWNQFTNGAVRLLNDYAGVGGASRVKLHLFLKVLNPTQAYKTLVARLFTDGAVPARVNLVGGSGLQGQLNAQLYAQALGDSVPFYLSDPFVALVLLGWLVAAPAVGYYVFRDADL
ncbi:MAG: ABC transporter permease [Halobacteriales archaeon]|nr:ABC transporter permease [Halobacteriales archaeon]